MSRILINGETGRQSRRGTTKEVGLFPPSLNPCASAQSGPTHCDPTDCSPPGSSVHEDSPGKNTGVGCPALLQGIFPTQGLNLLFLCLLHCRWILYPLSHLGGAPKPETRRPTPPTAQSCCDGVGDQSSCWAPAPWRATLARCPTAAPEGQGQGSEAPRRGRTRPRAPPLWVRPVGSAGGWVPPPPQPAGGAPQPGQSSGLAGRHGDHPTCH